VVYGSLSPLPLEALIAGVLRVITRASSPAARRIPRRCPFGACGARLDAANGRDVITRHRPLHLPPVGDGLSDAGDYRRWLIDGRRSPRIRITRPALSCLRRPLLPVLGPITKRKRGQILGVGCVHCRSSAAVERGGRHAVGSKGATRARAASSASTVRAISWGTCAVLTNPPRPIKRSTPGRSQAKVRLSAGGSAAAA
jgi:hypothetical protein